MADHSIELNIKAKDEATAKIEGVVDSLGALPEDEITINLGIRAAELSGQIDDLRAELTQLEDPVEIEARAGELVKLTAELEVVEDKIRDINGVEVDVEVDSRAARNLDDLKESLDEIEDTAGKQIRLDIEAQRATKSIRDIEKELARLVESGADEVEIRARVEDLARAQGELEDLKKLAEDDYDIEVNVRSNQRGGRSIRDTGDDIEYVRRQGEGMQSAIPAIRGFGDELGGTAQGAGIASQAIADLGDFALISGEKFAAQGSKMSSVATKLGTVLGSAGLAGAIAGIGVQIVQSALPALKNLASGQGEVEEQTKEATEAIEGQFNVLQGLKDLYPDAPILEAYLGDEAGVESGIDLLRNFTFGLGELRDEKESLDDSPEDTLSRWMDDVNLDVPAEYRDRLAELMAGGLDAATALTQLRLENADLNADLTRNPDRYFDLEDDLLDIEALRNELSAPIDDVLTKRLEQLAEFTGTAVGDEASQALADIESGALSVEDAYLGVVDAVEGIGGEELDEAADASARVGEEADRARREVDEFTAAEQAAERQAKKLADALSQVSVDDIFDGAAVRRAEAFGDALKKIDATDVGEPFRAARDGIRGFVDYLDEGGINIGEALANSLDGSELSDAFVAELDSLDDAMQAGLTSAFERLGPEGALGFYDSFVAQLEGEVGKENAAAILERQGFTREQIVQQIGVAVNQSQMATALQLLDAIDSDTDEAKQLRIDILLGNVTGVEALEGVERVAENDPQVNVDVNVDPLTDDSWTEAYGDPPPPPPAVVSIEGDPAPAEGVVGDFTGEGRETKPVDIEGDSDPADKEADDFVNEKRQTVPVDVRANLSPAYTTINTFLNRAFSTAVDVYANLAPFYTSINSAINRRFTAVVDVRARQANPGGADGDPSTPFPTRLAPGPQPFSAARAASGADDFDPLAGAIPIHPSTSAAQPSTVNNVTVNLPRAADARELRKVLSRFERVNGRR